MPRFASVPELFSKLGETFQSDRARGDRATLQFDLSGTGGGRYWVRIDQGRCEAGSGDAPGPADVTILASAEDWLRITNGDLNPMTAFMQGKVKVQGNFSLALKLQSWFAV